MIELGGVDEERLKERARFLESRAEAHLVRRDDDRHVVCAATLYRDAGCIRFLLEDFEAGKAQLHRAGDLLLGIRSALGLPLTAMTEPGLAADQMSKFLETRDKRSRHPAEQSSSRWMLSLVQADIVIGANIRVQRQPSGQGQPADDDLLRAPRTELVERYGHRPVGSTGLSVARYVSVARMLEANELDQRLQRAVGWLGEYRRELLEVARQDAFHWKLIARPAELVVDLDSVVLMMAAHGRGRDSIGDWLNSFDDAVVALPLYVANQLIGRSRRRGHDLGR